MLYNNKCVVLGGSFNPPTRAHKELMDHAMRHSEAGRGFFVPSSENYIRRKMRRHGSPMVFSEDARRKMLETFVTNRPDLAVSLAEYGDDGRGHTYRTMKTLQGQFPELELCFLAGADKLKIIPKWHGIEAFLSEFRFIITSRDGSAARGMIDADPLLSKYKSRFTVIPELPGNASASSTEARDCLRQGKFDAAARQLTPDVLSICRTELKAWG